MICAAWLCPCLISFIPILLGWWVLTVSIYSFLPPSCNILLVPYQLQVGRVERDGGAGHLRVQAEHPLRHALLHHDLLVPHDLHDPRLLQGLQVF